MVAKAKSSLLGSATKLQKEAKASFNADAERRLKDQSKILTADDLSGEYNQALKQLFTREGGLHQITNEDLQAFRYRLNLIKKRHSAQGRFKGGITAQKVIDLSASTDIKRARDQIRTAIPVSSKGSVIHFQTNASAKSESTRHHVYVEFLDFASWSATDQKPLFAANKLIKTSPLRFDCDCGRHTFWYRYIASVGGYAYGRLEDGYPKIKNPMLYGCACKHVINVMSIVLQSGTFKQYLIKMIERNRQTLTGRQKGFTEKEQEKFAEELKKEGKKLIVKKELSPAMKRLNEQIATRGMEEAVKKIKKAVNKEKEISKQLQSLAKSIKQRNPDLDDDEAMAVAKMREAKLRKNL